MSLTKNPNVLKWVDEMIALCQPDKVVWIDGSKEQLDALTEEVTSLPDDSWDKMYKLNPEKYAEATIELIPAATVESVAFQEPSVTVYTEGDYSLLSLLQVLGTDGTEIPAEEQKPEESPESAALDEEGE